MPGSDFAHRIAKAPKRKSKSRSPHPALPMRRPSKHDSPSSSSDHADIIFDASKAAQLTSSPPPAAKPAARTTATTIKPLSAATLPFDIQANHLIFSSPHLSSRQVAQSLFTPQNLLFPPPWSPDSLDLHVPSLISPTGVLSPQSPAFGGVAAAAPANILPVRGLATEPLTVEFNADQKRSLLSYDAALALGCTSAPFSAPSLHGPTVKIWIHEVPLSVSVLPDLGNMVRQRYLMLGRPAIEQLQCLLYLIKNNDVKDMLQQNIDTALAKAGWKHNTAATVTIRTQH